MTSDRGKGKAGKGKTGGKAHGKAQGKTTAKAPAGKATTETGRAHPHPADETQGRAAHFRRRSEALSDGSALVPPSC